MVAHMAAARLLGRLGVVAVLLFVASSPSRAFAGNLDSFPLGNEAAMTGGALVASTRDSAATWYNPAGLAKLGRDSIDGSASAFSYRVYVLPAAVRVHLPDGAHTADATSSAVLSVPESLVTARRVNDRITVGIGVFEQRQDFVSVRAAVSAQGMVAGGSAYSYSTAFDVVQQVATYYAGPAVGWSVTPRLQLGAALFGGYTTLTTLFDFGSTLTNGGDHATGVLERNASIDVVGVRPVAGLQWEPVDGWDVGFVVRAPYVGLAGKQRITGIDQQSVVPASGGAGTSLSLPNDSSVGTSVQIVEPARFHGGFAHFFDRERGWIGMGIDYQMPQNNDDGTPKSTSVWNMQVGGRWSASDTVSFGAGLFTDRSPTPATYAQSTLENQIDHISSARIDFTGASGGVEYRRRYSAVREGDDPRRPRGLEFSTTLALRYAYGHGTIQGAAVEPLTSAPNDYRPISTQATVHEINVHIGSALYF
jgi:hypothetical protein